MTAAVATRVLLLALLLPLASSALAGTPSSLMRGSDGFPAQPITILVPRASGGASYQVSVALGAALEEVTGVPVEILTRPANTGLDALDYFLSLPPNGYSILENQDELFGQYAQGETAVNPATDLLCLGAFLAYSQLYVRANEDRFADLPGLVACARGDAHGCRGDGDLRVSLFGGEGMTEAQLLSAVEKRLGFQAQRRFIANPAERYLSLLKGDVDLLLEQPGDVGVFLRRGLIRPLLSFRDGPLGAWPEVPSYLDLEGEMPELPRLRGFFVHPDTPRSRVDYLRRAIEAATRTAVMDEYMRDQYISPEDLVLGSDALDALMKSSVETYRLLTGGTNSEARP